MLTIPLARLFCRSKFASRQKKLTRSSSENAHYSFVLIRAFGTSTKGSMAKADVTLENIDTWDKMYEENKDDLKTLLSESKYHVHSSFNINKDLNKKVSIWQGDITQLKIDAIVNAANSSLMGGGGVDGAIHRAAGPELKAECRTLHGCETGNAKITKGYRLPAKYVIHTVGPRGEKPDLLRSCYQKSLDLLLENGLQSVAFPCISTGVYDYPSLEAAHEALTTVRNFLEKHSTDVERIIFCLFLPKDVNIYKTLLQLYFPVEQ